MPKIQTTEKKSVVANLRTPQQLGLFGANATSNAPWAPKKKHREEVITPNPHVRRRLNLQGIGN